MATKRLVFKPGVNTQLTPALNSQGISTSNLIRYRSGLPEKYGGWGRISDQHMVGSVRAMHAWADLSGQRYLAFGSEQRLQVLQAGVGIFDITPIRKTTDAASILSTTNGSPLVRVDDAGHGAAVGDWINISIPTAIANLFLYGFYKVTVVLSANAYAFDAGKIATSAVALAGTVPRFITTNGSADVTVSIANYPYLVGDVFTVQIPTTVGGLTVSGQYIVQGIVSSSQFTITASAVATSDANAFENGGNIEILYLIASGFASDTAVSGWGAGTYGSGPYGGAGAVTTISPLRNWSLANFGQNLQAVYTNGPLYQWVPPPEIYGNPAAVISAAPSINWAMFVAMPQEQVILLGSSVMGVQDPLLISWCDAGDNTDWTATPTNQAGTFRLSRGSQIIGGLQAPHTALIWTDIELWSMTYIGPPFIYDFETVGAGCGLIAKNACGILGERIFWMSQKNFFVLDGQGLRIIPCDVWDAIFKGLNPRQLAKTTCFPNSNFGEIGWFYCSADSDEIDSYVKLSVVEGTWDYGTLERLAWTDQSVFGPPIGVDEPDGLLQQHETSVDADGNPMTGVSFVTGFADLSDGQDIFFVDRLIPDFKWEGSSNTSAQKLALRVYLTEYPGTAPTIKGPYIVRSTTKYITIRSRARQVALGIQSDALGVQWRLGVMRIRGAPDGRL